MKRKDFDWQIDELMVYCRSTQLRPQTMKSYEQTLRLFERWCLEQMDITTVDKVTESVIRHYIRDIQERGKIHLPCKLQNILLYWIHSKRKKEQK